MALQITPLPSAPQRTDPPAVFVPKADAHVASLVGFVTETNALAVEAETNAQTAATASTTATAAATAANVSATAAASSADFKGRWIDLTGALSIPASVERGGQVYQLLENLADVTLEDPLTSSKWLLINDVNMANVRVSKLDNPIAHLFKKNKIAEVLNGNVSVTRNTTATYVDRNGAVRTAAIDIPREEATGCLFEGASENLMLRSEEFDNAAWSKSSSAITADSAVSPDTTVTADKFEAGSTASITPNVFQAVTSIAAQSSTTYYFVNAVEATFVQVQYSGGQVANNPRANFDLTAGVLGTVDGDITATITALAGGYFLITSTVVAVGVTLTPQLVLIKTATDTRGQANSWTAGDGLLVWGGLTAQLPFAPSYTPTTTIAVTRSADDISASSDDNFVEAEGSIFFKADVIGDTGADQYLLEVSDGTNNNRHAIIRSSDKIRLLIVDGGVTQVDISTTFNMDVDTQYGIAVNYKDNNVELFVDGVSIGTDTSCTMPTGLTIINIGKTNSSGNEQFGHNQDLRINDFRYNTDEIKYLGGQ